MNPGWSSEAHQKVASRHTVNTHPYQKKQPNALIRYFGAFEKLVTNVCKQTAVSSDWKKCFTIETIEGSLPAQRLPLVMVCVPPGY